MYSRFKRFGIEVYPSLRGSGLRFILALRGLGLRFRASGLLYFLRALNSGFSFISVYEFSWYEVYGMTFMVSGAGVRVYDKFRV